MPPQGPQHDPSSPRSGLRLCSLHCDTRASRPLSEPVPSAPLRPWLCPWLCLPGTASAQQTRTTVELGPGPPVCLGCSFPGLPPGGHLSSKVMRPPSVRCYHLLDLPLTHSSSFFFLISWNWSFYCFVLFCLSLTNHIVSIFVLLSPYLLSSPRRAFYPFASLADFKYPNHAWYLRDTQ